MGIPKLSIRNVPARVELRDGEAGATGNRLAGYAARFGVESCPLDDWFAGSFTEVIRAGAFARSLRENPDIRALYNHDDGVVLGRTKNRTLRLSEDAEGLRFEVDLPDTTQARDVKALVSGGYIDGCSFGFLCREDEVLKRKDGTILRTLVDVELIEISPAVAFPAYDATSVSVRSRATKAPKSRLDAVRRRMRLIELGAKNGGRR